MENTADCTSNAARHSQNEIPIGTTTGQQTIQSIDPSVLLCQLQNQMCSNMLMLNKPDVPEISMMSALKIDAMLGIVCAYDFDSLIDKVKSKCAEGLCVLTLKTISDCDCVDIQSIGVTVNNLLNLVNSKAYAREMSKFLQQVVCCLSSDGRPNPGSVLQKFWKCHQIDSNGDIDITIVCIDVKFGSNDKPSLKTGMLKIGVPRELVGGY